MSDKVKAFWHYESFQGDRKVGAGYNARSINDVLACVRHTLECHEEAGEPLTMVKITRETNENYHG
jgi:hypothetical protein